MRKIVLAIILFTTALFAFGQSFQEVIHLKNGSVVKGQIIEQIPKKSLKIATTDGNVFVFNMSDVESITKEAPVSNERRRQLLIEEREQKRVADRAKKEKEREMKREAVRARRAALPNRFFIAAGLNMHPSQKSLNLRLGMCKVWGWYGEIKTDFHLMDDYDFEVDGLDHIFIKGDKINGRFALLAGCIYKPNRTISLNLGAGYGKRWLHAETRGNKIVRVTPNTASGFEIEGGMALHINKVFFPVGVSYILGGDYGEINIGIGASL